MRAPWKLIRDRFTKHSLEFQNYGSSQLESLAPISVATVAVFEWQLQSRIVKPISKLNASPVISRGAACAALRYRGLGIFGEYQLCTTLGKPFVLVRT